MINNLVIIRCTEMWASVMLTDYPFIPEGSGRQAHAARLLSAFNAVNPPTSTIHYKRTS